jgi:hypothetical protein
MSWLSKFFSLFSNNNDSQPPQPPQPLYPIRLNNTQTKTEIDTYNIILLLKLYGTYPYTSQIINKWNDIHLKNATLETIPDYTSLIKYLEEVKYNIQNFMEEIKKIENNLNIINSNKTINVQHTHAHTRTHTHTHTHTQPQPQPLNPSTPLTTTPHTLPGFIRETNGVIQLIHDNKDTSASQNQLESNE